MEKYDLILFIFRRDLRLEDNLGLIWALQNSSQVLPCFIFDPRQCETNDYKGDHSLQFMLESLEDLQTQLAKKNGQLFLFYGIAEEIIAKVIMEKKISAVCFNRDYTPFSKERDQAIAAICEKHTVSCHTFDDALLHPPLLTLKQDSTPYQIFSRFYVAAKLMCVPEPQKNNYKNYYRGKLALTVTTKIFEKILPKRTKNLAAKGGRRACLKRLQLLKNIKHYTHDHNYPSKNATSGLSPHLKFTTCSVREIYFAMKKMPVSESIVRELYWRDFFTMIAYYFPHIFGNAFREKYNRVKWHNKISSFKAWCEGRTGFPIVDAGMRELNQTGYMHNRVRLITASFLVKDLHIDWRWGEKYFARQLTDYDPAVNNGNWQWVAGTGTDAQPYFRIFNPWLQQKKFDKDCAYIKRWVPELQAVTNKIVHNWYKKEYHPLVTNYPIPIVDHTVEAKLAKSLYIKLG